LGLVSEVGGLGGVVIVFILFICRDLTYSQVVRVFIRNFFTNSEGQIYKIDSNKDIPDEDDIIKTETIGTEFSTFEVLYPIFWL